MSAEAVPVAWCIGDCDCPEHRAADDENRAMRNRARKVLAEPAPVHANRMSEHIGRQAAAREILGL